MTHGNRTRLRRQRPWRISYETTDGKHHVATRASERDARAEAVFLASLPAVRSVSVERRPDPA